jgi:hypothetical protein
VNKKYTFWCLPVLTVFLTFCAASPLFADDTIRRVVLDWAGKANGVSSLPSWVTAYEMGNKTKIMEALEIPEGKAVEVAMGRGENLGEAQIEARLNCVTSLTGVMYTRIENGISYYNGMILGLVSELARKSLFTDFWMLIETVNSISGAKTHEYLWWSVYVMDSDWQILLWKEYNSFWEKSLMKSFP